MVNKRKPTPKRALFGADDLKRYTVSKGKESEKSSPLHRRIDFEMDGYHTKPTGGASNTKHGSQRKDYPHKQSDYPFLKHTETKGK